MAFDLRIVDEPPSTRGAPIARPRRWHLRHRWVLVKVEAGSTYVGCATCGRLRTPTIFEPPLP
jgi:hypothetical protein